MLKEIKFAELIKDIKDPVLIIKDGQIVTLEDLFQGARVLIDTETTVARKLDDDKPPKKVAQGRRKSAEQRVLNAWKGGERSIEEVCKITGFSMPVVRKYLPISREG